MEDNPRLKRDSECMCDYEQMHSVWLGQTFNKIDRLMYRGLSIQVYAMLSY